MVQEIQPTAAAAPSAAMSTTTDKSHTEQPASPKKDREEVKDGSMDSSSKDEDGPQTSSSKTRKRERERVVLQISILPRLQHSPSHSLIPSILLFSLT